MRVDAAFERRVTDLRSDLVTPLSRLFADPEMVADRLIDLARARHAERSAELIAMDEKRLAHPDWFQTEQMLGYAAYTDRFAGTLRDLPARIPHLRDLGVTYLHLMPLLQPRPEPSDGGYAVADYTHVRSDLGANADLETLTGELRANGISLCIDLVLNHTAREHPWAVAARAGDAAKRDYYLIYPDRTEPDAYEATLPEVFPDFAPGSFTHDAEMDAWVWTTFNDYQWDLNWANPAVLEEFAEILLGWANAGVEIFRLDAIAFMWKRLGTNCQNQPEVHDITQALRTVIRMAAPAVLFKAEAIVGRPDLPAYLGLGDHAGKVSDLAYHNSLMVQTWSMLASGEVALAAHALKQFPQPPDGTSWLTYVRCHDDIGWAIDDEDALAVGVTGHGHRRFLSDWYSGDFPGSWARGLVFQENPATGDRRISGMAASLVGADCGDPHADDRLLLSYALALSFGGLPMIWMGDEWALPSDPDWADEAGHADDNRWAHRPRFPSSPPPGAAGVWPRLQHLIATRRSLPQLHAAVTTEVWDPQDPGVLLVVRRHANGPLLAAFNVTATPRPVPDRVLDWLGLEPDQLVDHLTGSAPGVVDGGLMLEPYQAVWITAS